MIRRPPRSTRTDTLFPYTTLFRSFRPAPDRAVAKATLGLSGPVIISTGALIPRKGQDLLTRALPALPNVTLLLAGEGPRSEEHTSELQSLMRISYAVFCLKKKTKQQQYNNVIFT